MTVIIGLCIAACLLIIGICIANPFMSFRYVLLMSLSGLVLCAVALKCVGLWHVERCSAVYSQDCGSVANR